MEITVEIGKTENCVVDLAIGVPSAELDKRKDALLRKWSERAVIPGFRKGHAPKAILEKQFGPQAMAEGFDELLKDAVREVLEKENLMPISTPKVTDLQTDNGKIRFKVSVEIRPEVTLTDKQILGIKLPKPADLAVTDDDITRAIENELKSRSTFVPVLEVRPCRAGDFVAVDYEGFLKDGDAPIEGGKAEGAMLELGGMKFLPGFDEQVTGMSPGGKKRVDITFPADFYDDALQNKAAYFHVTLKAIKRREMPEATDEWAQEQGYDNLVDARGKIRTEMERGSKELSKEELRRALFAALDEKIDFSIPPSLLDRQVGELWKGLERQHKGGRAELLERISKDGKTEADLDQDLRARAKRQIKNSLILDAVAKLKNIQVTDRDVEDKIAGMAEEFKTTPETVRQELEKNDRLGEVRYALLDEKVVQFLLDHADIR